MSFWTDDLFTADNGTHAAVGALMSSPLIYAAILWWPTAPIVVALWIVWGWLREQAQYAAKWKERGEESSLALWLDWWSLHKVLEGASWGLGPAIVLGVASAF